MTSHMVDKHLVHIAGLEQKFGAVSEEVAVALNTLAGLICQYEESEDAVPYFERCLAIREALGGPASILPWIDGWLGQCRHMSFRAREPFLLKRLDIMASTQGEFDQRISDQCDSLASIYLNLNRLADARLLERSLAIKERLKGAVPEHALRGLDRAGACGQIESSRMSHRYRKLLGSGNSVRRRRFSNVPAHRSMIVLCLVSALILFASQRVDAAGADLEALVANARNDLVSLACPKSGDGLLRVTALVYTTDSPPVVGGSRTYTLTLSGGRPSSIRYSVDLGRANEDYELLRGDYSVPGGTIGAVWAGGKKAEPIKDYEPTVRLTTTIALTIADEFCVRGSPSSTAEATMIRNRKNSGWPSYVRP